MNGGDGARLSQCCLLLIFAVQWFKFDDDVVSRVS